jgi:hypothetical protein
MFGLMLRKSGGWTLTRDDRLDIQKRMIELTLRGLDTKRMTDLRLRMNGRLDTRRNDRLAS